MKKRFVLFALLFLVVLSGLGFLVWANNSLPAMPQALEALRSDEQVQVDRSSWIVFSPAGQNPTVGVIFYPGGKVDPQAYAPPMRRLAEDGLLAVIVPMPLNLAVFAPSRAAEVIKAFPQVQRWLIGGHSLGGSMAANFARHNPDALSGLYLWASFPANSDDLSTSGLSTLSIYADQDGLVTIEEIETSHRLLPAETQFFRVAGGNHAQFGWYGAQPGDNSAQISRDNQQDQTVQAMLDWIANLQP